MSDSSEPKYATGHSDYDKAVDELYHKLFSELRVGLISSSDPLAEATGRLEMWHYLLRAESPDDEIGNVVKGMFRFSGLDGKKIKIYGDQILKGEEESLLSDAAVNFLSLAVAKALIFYLRKLSYTIDHIIDNDGSTKGLLQEIPVTSNSFEETRINVLRYKDTYYGWLLATYKRNHIDATQISQISTEAEFIKFELNQFNELLSIDNNQHNWTGLLKRLDCKNVEEINLLHEVAIEMQGGNFVEYITTFNFDKQILAGKILAIKDYVLHLYKQISKEKSKQHDKSDKEQIEKDGLTGETPLFTGETIKVHAIDNRIKIEDGRSGLVRDLFSLLTLDKNGGETDNRVMTPQALEQFLCSNFTCFKPKTERIQLDIHETADKTHLRYFIYRMYETLKNDKSELEEYRNLLKRNFKIFESNSSTNLTGQFSKPPVGFPRILDTHIKELFKQYLKGHPKS